MDDADLCECVSRMFGKVKAKSLRAVLESRDAGRAETERERARALCERRAPEHIKTHLSHLHDLADILGLRGEAQLTWRVEEEALGALARRMRQNGETVVALEHARYVARSLFRDPTDDASDTRLRLLRRFLDPDRLIERLSRGRGLEALRSSVADNPFASSSLERLVAGGRLMDDIRHVERVHHRALQKLPPERPSDDAF